MFRVPSNGNMYSSSGRTDVRPPFVCFAWCVFEVDAAMIVSDGHQTIEMRELRVVIVVLVTIVLFLCNVSCSLNESCLQRKSVFYLVVYLSFWRSTGNLM